MGYAAGAAGAVLSSSAVGPWGPYYTRVPAPECSAPSRWHAICRLEHAAAHRGAGTRNDPGASSVVFGDGRAALWRSTASAERLRPSHLPEGGRRHDRVTRVIEKSQQREERDRDAQKHLPPARRRTRSDPGAGRSARGAAGLSRSDGATGGHVRRQRRCLPLRGVQLHRALSSVHPGRGRPERVQLQQRHVVHPDHRRLHRRSVRGSELQQRGLGLRVRQHRPARVGGGRQPGQLAARDQRVPPDRR